MPITSVTTDAEELTMRIVAEFPVSVNRLWDAYADPRRLEKFWGPPGWPATFTRHDLFVGGWSHYAMRSPDGESSAGYWQFEEVEAPRRFSVVDGFALESGEPDPNLPSMRMGFDFESTSDGSRLTTTTHFNSAEDLEQLVGMGMEEGTRAAMDQIDSVLEDAHEFAVGGTTHTQFIGETKVRISRIIDGARQAVWDAHHDPKQLRAWLRGPDGWSMPVCEVATSLGEQFRYEWEQEDGSERFGFTGELLEMHPPNRSVTTERLLGTDGPITVNELTLTPMEGGGTLLALITTYPDAEARQMILETGMVDGMEASYARLEREVLA